MTAVSSQDWQDFRAPAGHDGREALGSARAKAELFPLASRMACGRAAASSREPNEEWETRYCGATGASAVGGHRVLGPSSEALEAGKRG